jgi:hypothetical protein
MSELIKDETNQKVLFVDYHLSIHKDTGHICFDKELTLEMVQKTSPTTRLYDTYTLVETMEGKLCLRRTLGTLYHEPQGTTTT